MEKIKFSSKIDLIIWERLQEYVKESKLTISDVLSEAVDDFLSKVGVRPAFKEAAQEGMQEYDELLQRLAK